MVSTRLRVGTVSTRLRVRTVSAGLRVGTVSAGLHTLPYLVGRIAGNNACSRERGADTGF